MSKYTSGIYISRPLLCEKDRLLTTDELLSFWDKDRRADRSYNNKIRNLGIYYDQDINRIESLLQLENRLSTLYDGYQFNMLTINSKKIYGNYKNGKNIHLVEDYLNLIKRIVNNIRFTGFMDYILGYCWVLEKGPTSRRWHVHMGVFYRDDVYCDILLLFLKNYIERISMLDTYSLEYRCFCSFDNIETVRYRKSRQGKMIYLTEPEYRHSENKIGIVRKEDYRGRNKVLKKLLYFSKVEYKKETWRGSIDNRRRDKSKGYRKHRDNYRDVKEKQKLFGYSRGERRLKEMNECRDIPRVSNDWLIRGLSMASMIYYKWSRDFSIIESQLLNKGEVDRIVGDSERWLKDNGLEYYPYRLGVKEDLFRRFI